ncbi:hypothetical protein CSOJ01_15295 [Colletotrichum sojae]|uniref:Uncharacterized protein n=1 Tax=Colletotrichum sojae TaxID=2175907 RepID=A0A8H6INJ7_9PEZI|nr:hypothetical protein CSOJ01_15295 [Colletotrichum sojae]
MADGGPFRDLGTVGLRVMAANAGILYVERPKSPSSVSEDGETLECRLLSLPLEVVRGIFHQVSRLHPRAPADSSMSSLCKTCRALAAIGTPILYSHFENNGTVFGVRKLVLFWTTLFGHNPRQKAENKPYLVKDNPHLPKADNHLWQYVKSLAITFPAHDTNHKAALDLLGAEASLSEAVVRFYIYLLEERTTGRRDSERLSSQLESWKHRFAQPRTEKQRFYCEPSDVNQMASMAAVDLMRRCHNVESIGWLNDYASTNVFNRLWQLGSKEGMKNLRSVTIAQETHAAWGHGRTEAWWVPLAASICRDARDVTVKIVAETNHPLMNARMDLRMPNHISLGKDLTTLDFQHSSMSPQAMKTVLTSCGPLASFTYFPMPYKAAFWGTEIPDTLFCHSDVVAECLRTHKDTLRYLTLVMTPLHFNWGIRRRPMGSLKDFTALSQLTLDTSCYGKYERLVDILPRQLDTFRLIGCHETMEWDLLDLARSDTRSFRCGYPGLSSVALIPWPNERMNPTEERNLETMRDVFATKGAEFVFGDKHRWAALVSAWDLFRQQTSKTINDFANDGYANDDDGGSIPTNEGDAGANVDTASSNGASTEVDENTPWKRFRRDSDPWAIT